MVNNILSIRSHEPEGYYCACGQKNWPGTRCARCGRPDPTPGANYPYRGGRS